MFPSSWLELFPLFFLVFSVETAPTTPFNIFAAPTLPPSPLDRPSSKPKPNLDGRNLVNDLSKLSTCQKGCSSGLTDSLGIVIKSMSHIQRYEQICKNYKDSYNCIEKERKCGKEDFSMFETFASGVRYMCVDQKLAFQNTIKCIDAQSNQVQEQCDQECGTKNKIMQLVMRSSVMKEFLSPFKNVPGGSVAAQAAAIPPIDPNTLIELNAMSAELCEVGDCVLKCVKGKFDTQCEGSAGSLLTEVIVRPIATTQDKMATILPIMGIFVPKQCSYIYSGSDLQKYRIDPSVESDVRRMYNKKEEEKKLVNVKPIKPPVLTMPQIPSPLDSPTSINVVPKPKDPKNALIQSGKIPVQNGGKRAGKPAEKVPASGPVKPTAVPKPSGPVKPTPGPVTAGKTASGPVAPTPAPGSVSSGPVKPTGPQKKPGNGATASVTPSSAPVTPSKPPSDPVRPTPTPVTSSPGPIKPTKPSSAPVSPSPGPVKPTKGNPASQRPTVGPKTSPSPTSPTRGPASTPSVPVKPTPPPSQVAKPIGNPSSDSKVAQNVNIHRCRH